MKQRQFICGFLLIGSIQLVLLLGCSNGGDTSMSGETEHVQPVDQQQLDNPLQPAAPFEQPQPVQAAPEFVQPVAPDYRLRTEPLIQPTNPAEFIPRSLSRTDIGDVQIRDRQLSGIPKTGQPNALLRSQPIAQPKQAMQPQAMQMAVEPESAPVIQVQPRVATAEMQSAMAPEIDKVQQYKDYDVVELFYGTDRKGVAADSISDRMANFYSTFGSFGATVVLGGFFLVIKRPKAATIFGILGISVTLFLAKDAISDADKYDRAVSTASMIYGSERGELDFGQCKVSIPKSHEAGQLEAPSILKLELTEAPEKHVVLLEVLSKEEETFFADLKQRVSQTPSGELLVFVHGYNVSFEDAARRTAQISHDLNFQGVPLFYSWPSQANIAGYNIDRQNSLWTVTHLKEFLIKLSRNSGAKSVNLIAHSMGNRALGTALKEIAYEFEGNAQMFNQVILAAPDVDADVFHNEIAPQIIKTAERVTLYASRNDLALIASKNINGFARAGDSGDGMIIAPGIETIDVSAIDSSLVGHSYYGDNTSIICDIFSIIHYGQSANNRQWLRPVVSGTNGYWVFDRNSTGITSHADGRLPR